MIKFNWMKIFKESGGNPSEILNIIAYITYKPIPKNNYDNIKRFVGKDWDGDSYLINPSRVLSLRGKEAEKELAEYVALASFRSLADYLVTGRKTLLVYESPIPTESITKNKFFTIQGDYVYFSMEETTQ